MIANLSIRKRITYFCKGEDRWAHLFSCKHLLEEMFPIAPAQTQSSHELPGRGHSTYTNNANEGNNKDESYIVVNVNNI